VTKQAIEVRDQTKIENVLTAQLTNYHVIIITIDATEVWLNVIGAGGSATGIMDKCGFCGIPSESIYFVATGDSDAVDTPPTELLSAGLKQKLGPMQHDLLADYMQYGRFLSWMEHPAPQQVKLLTNHLHHLARNKLQPQVGHCSMHLLLFASATCGPSSAFILVLIYIYIYTCSKFFSCILRSTRIDSFAPYARTNSR
jgi:hypothetical protein